MASRWTQRRGDHIGAKCGVPSGVVDLQQQRDKAAGQRDAGDDRPAVDLGERDPRAHPLGQVPPSVRWRSAGSLDRERKEMEPIAIDEPRASVSRGDDRESGSPRSARQRRCRADPRVGASVRAGADDAWDIVRGIPPALAGVGVHIADFGGDARNELAGISVAEISPDQSPAVELSALPAGIDTGVEVRPWKAAGGTPIATSRGAGCPTDTGRGQRPTTRSGTRGTCGSTGTGGTHCHRAGTSPCGPCDRGAQASGQRLRRDRSPDQKRWPANSPPIHHLLPITRRTSPLRQPGRKWLPRLSLDSLRLAARTAPRTGRRGASTVRATLALGCALRAEGRSRRPSAAWRNGG